MGFGALHDILEQSGEQPNHWIRNKAAVNHIFVWILIDSLLQKNRKIVPNCESKLMEEIYAAVEYGNIIPNLQFLLDRRKQRYGKKDIREDIRDIRMWLI